MYKEYLKTIEKQIGSFRPLFRSGFLVKNAQGDSKWEENPLEILFKILYYSLLAELVMLQKVISITSIIKREKTVC